MRNLYLLLLLSFLFPQLACDGYLDEDPPHFISESNFFQTETHARTAMDGVYESLMTGVGGIYGRWWPGIDAGTDDVTSVQNSTTLVPIYEHLINGDFGWLNSFGQYSEFWIGIARANDILDKVPSIDMDERIKNNILGEARALRALLYFHLVKTYGDLPMVTTIIREEENFLIPRSPIDQIYDEIIIPDLQFAEENCKDELHDGRVTKWTAKIILADVYLTRAGWRRTTQGEFVQGSLGNWSLARDKAKEIIDNSPHELITEPLINGANITPACGVAWGEETPFTKEAMLELAGVNISGFGSWLSRESFSNRTGANFWGTNVRTKPFEADGIDLTIDEMKFPQSVGSGIYIPTADLWRSFEPGDERRDWGMLTRYISPGGDLFLLRPSFRKYIDINFALGAPNTSFRNTNNNFLLYRYADALLIYAEAANEVAIATTGDASYAAVNEIRRRAGLEDLPPALTQDQFRRAVWKERRTEFHGECKRRFDLIRTNRLRTETEDIQTEWLESDNPPYAVPHVNVSPAYGTQPFPDHEWLMPIPTPELQLNIAAGWEQNAGY